MRREATLSFDLLSGFLKPGVISLVLSRGAGPQKINKINDGTKWKNTALWSSWLWRKKEDGVQKRLFYQHAYVVLHKSALN